MKLRYSDKPGQPCCVEVQDQKALDHLLDKLKEQQIHGRFWDRVTAYPYGGILGTTYWYEVAMLQAAEVSLLPWESV